tara:strand:- start:1096 stop:2157 length:1062 start_codon:yes stop_codon:yes gene_type:complete
MIYKKRIAIVGGGIFGSTITIRLARKGYFCDLFEKNNSIMNCASRVNQYRLHKGYHYPRSGSTVNQLLNSYSRFIEEYYDAVEKKYTHLYALAKEKSLTSKEEYLQFLNRHSLKYEILDFHPNLINEKFNLIFIADEHLIDYHKLKKIVEERLGNNPLINLKLNTEFKKNSADEYDFVIFCGYGLTSKIIPGELKKKYKFQLVEKLVVKPPKSLSNTSLVIIDGPFMCIDPIPDKRLSVLGNVKKAIYETSYGFEPNMSKIDKNPAPWVDEYKEKNTRFEDFINHGAEYISDFKECKFNYSMRGFRVVPMNVELTDERLSILRNHDKYIEVLSGKIDSCSWVADKVLEKITSL